jgi:hypothetical protein
MLRVPLFAVLVVFPFFCADAAVDLRSIAEVQTSGYGLSDSKYDREDTGLVANPGTAFLEMQAAVSSSNPPSGGAAGSASASMTTQFGEFHTVLSAAASSAVYHSYVAAHAYGFGQWDDVVTVTSATLPIGTHVNITATVEVDRTVSDPSPGSIWWINLYTSGYQYYDGYDRPNASNTMTLRYFGTVGYSFDVYQTLNAYAATQTVANGQEDSIGLDIGHTIHFYLDAPSGVTLTSSSGATYAPAALTTPEPATATIWLAAILGWPLFRARRRMVNA